MTLLEKQIETMETTLALVREHAEPNETADLAEIAHRIHQLKALAFFRSACPAQRV